MLATSPIKLGRARWGAAIRKPQFTFKPLKVIPKLFKASPDTVAEAARDPSGCFDVLIRVEALLINSRIGVRVIRHSGPPPSSHGLPVQLGCADLAVHVSRDRAIMARAERPRQVDLHGLGCGVSAHWTAVLTLGKCAAAR